MTLLVASAGLLMVSLDATIVNVAPPTLARQLGASLSQLQWIVDGYTLVFAAVLITGGGLGDILGARGVFAAGLALFSAASVACGLAPSTGALIAAHFGQGLRAGVLVPTSLALVRSAFEDQQARTRGGAPGRQQVVPRLAGKPVVPRAWPVFWQA